MVNYSPLSTSERARTPVVPNRCVRLFFIICIKCFKNRSGYQKNVIVVPVMIDNIDYRKVQITSFVFESVFAKVVYTLRKRNKIRILPNYE
ncbi:hypothetical protein HMPREF9554_01715 [Treponema phagedenis F0421]|nr:hypothetical protein HMPREF9554_01715 [Treponema phagedenis F0421]